MPEMTKPERQVDVFEITEECGIEAVHVVEGVAVNERGRRAG